jgi:hypothetical protein
MPQAGDRVVFRHDWLAGAGEVTVDEAGRMLHYSGQRSTYKVEVVRVEAPPNVSAIGARLAAAEAESGAARLSQPGTTRGTVGSAELEVSYGRPLRRGRELLGALIPHDRVWRTGANEATQLTTSTPITLAGLELPAGSYTLWTIPRRDGAELIVNRQTGQWGTGYARDRDLGRAPLEVSEVAAPMERFTISIEDHGNSTGSLILEWGTFRWRAPIVVR